MSINFAIFDRHYEFDLTIAVPTYNGRLRIESLLLSLYALGYCDSDAVQILISDNCSTDRTPNFLETLPSKFSIIRQSRNIGFSRNILSLLVASKGKYIWILGDDDVINVPCHILLSTLGGSDSPKLFLSSQEYDILAGGEYSDYYPTVPLGFISSVIQPNLQAFIQAASVHLGEDTHASPHFFSRWRMLLILGTQALCRLPGDRPPVIGRPSFQRRSRFRRLIYRCYVIMTPWIIRHYSFNWYQAYRACCGSQDLLPIADYLFKAEVGYYLLEFRRDLLGTLASWLPQLPFLFVRDPSYGLYVAKVMSTAFSIYKR